MTPVHNDILAAAPEVNDAGLRLHFLCRAAGLTFSAIERAGELAPRSISAYAGGRGYAYPKLRRVVSEELAKALREDVEAVAEYLFGPSDIEAEAS